MCNMNLYASHCIVLHHITTHLFSKKEKEKKICMLMHSYNVRAYSCEISKIVFIFARFWCDRIERRKCEKSSHIYHELRYEILKNNKWVYARKIRERQTESEIAELKYDMVLSHWNQLQKNYLVHINENMSTVSHKSHTQNFFTLLVLFIQNRSILAVVIIASFLLRVKHEYILWGVLKSYVARFISILLQILLVSSRAWDKLISMRPQYDHKISYWPFISFQYP